MIQIECNTEETRELLGELRNRLSDLSPLMNSLGAVVVGGTQQRFVDQKAPDGTPWAPLSAVTLARRRGRGRGVQILRDTGRLMNSISYNATQQDCSVFSNVIYAGTHQLGARKGQYGQSRRGPIPWGNIPARPFLGVSADDQDAITEIIEGYIQANQPLSWWQRIVDRIKQFFR